MVVDGTGQEEYRDDSGAYFVVDRQQIVTEWSDRAAALLATPAAQALGRPCYSLVRGKNGQRGFVCQADCPSFQLLGDGRATAECLMDVTNGGPNARRIRCELQALPRHIGGAVGRFSDATVDGATRPISDPLSDPEPPSGILHALMAFANLSTSLEPGQLETSLERALDLLRTATAADSAEIFLTEPTGCDVLLTAYRGPFWRAFCQRPRFTPGQGFPGLVVERGEAIVSTELSHDQRFLRDAIKREGFQAYVCVPLRMGDRTLGVLCVGSRDEGFGASEALRLLTWCSVPIAIAIQAGLLQASRLDLTGAGDQPASDRDLDALLIAVLGQARDLAGADAGTITLYDRVHGAPLRTLSDGIDAVALAPCADSAHLAGACPALGAGHGIALFGPRRQWPLPCQQAARLGSSTSCVPMRHGGEDIGLIQLIYRDVAPLPPTRHLSLLLEFAAHAGMMLSLVRGGIEHHRGSRPVTENAGAGVDSPVGPAAIHRHGDRPYLRIRCLGSFEIERNGKALPPQAFKRRKAQMLLKLLVLHAGTPLAKESLIEWLWPECDPDSGSNRLHGVVHALRDTVEPASPGSDWRFIHFDGDHYLFDSHQACWVDLIEFRELIAEGQRAQTNGEPRAALDAFEAAIKLYRGDLFCEDRYAEWALLDREHLKETYLGALQWMAAHHARHDDRERAIGSYREILRTDPLREQTQRELIEALWRAGRRDEALLQFERFAHRLQTELDIAPLPETEALIRLVRATPR